MNRIQFSSVELLLWFGIGTFLMLFTNCKADYKDIFLKAHNDYRAKHHAPAMKYVDELNDAAQKCSEEYAEKRKIDHSCTTEGAGENLYASIGNPSPIQDKEIKASVDAWYNEIKDYDFSNPGNVKPNVMIGHFTQVIWKGSTELGVGIFTKGDFTAVVGKYKPQGNVRLGGGGDEYKFYKENVLMSDSSEESKRSDASEGSDGSNNSDSSACVGVPFGVTIIASIIIITVVLQTKIASVGLYDL